MSTYLRRIASGFGANVYGQGVTVLIQLVSVPIFLLHWDATTYGEWLMLYAVPAYFSMADAGFVLAAANRMSMLAARDDYLSANRVFQAALTMTVLLIVIFAAIAGAVLWTIDLEFLSSSDRKIALLFLIVVALANVFGGLFDAVFRANGEYALGTYVSNTARLVDLATGIGFLMWGFGFAGVAGGFLIGRTVASIATWLYVRKRFRQFVWRVTEARWSDVKQMFSPAIAFLAFPLGNAISIQGMSLLVGTVFGAAFLAQFNTYRTLSRILVQVMATISRAAWPEISRLFGERNYREIRRLCRIGTIASGLIGLVLAGILFIGADRLLDFWTHGKIPFDPALFGVLLLATVMTAFWQFAMVVTMATNTHERLSLVFIGASVFVILAAYLLVAYFGRLSPALALLFFEVAMLVSSHWLARQVTNARES